MFSLFYSEQKKMRRSAENWLEVADRVYNFRRDLLSASQNQRLLSAAGDVKMRLKERADASKLKMSVESLESVLREVGGRIYPVSSFRENIEFFLVAAIVILGLRAYFIQPFKIPTNSMWPSYYGMTGEVFQPGEEPGALRRVARLVGLGASNYSLTAPAAGEVFLAVGSNGLPAISAKPGRSLLIFPTVFHEYTFSVGGQLAKISVPADFDPRLKWLRESFQHAGQKPGAPLESSILALQDGAKRGESRVYWLPMGKTVQKGEKLFSFDILTGDLLFVERLSYNFVQPKVGSGFVFRTEKIDSPEMKDSFGQQIKQYYVKRLVGLPGDKLEIKGPALFRNGQPIEGSTAFGKNARKEGLYPGYVNSGLLGAGDVLEIPEHSFFAIGDNSPDSKDGRAWGFIPEKEVVGRPLLIYYPFTSRWGPAR
jgi:signal peptidase I